VRNPRIDATSMLVNHWGRPVKTQLLERSDRSFVGLLVRWPLVVGQHSRCRLLTSIPRA